MKASPQNLALLGLMERGQAASERNAVDRAAEEQANSSRFANRDMSLLATLTRVAPTKAKGSAPIGDEPLCLECMAELWVDARLNAWVCPACGKSGTVERGVRVTVTRGAGA